jgi:hypothetical protein
MLAEFGLPYQDPIFGEIGQSGFADTLEMPELYPDRLDMWG